MHYTTTEMKNVTCKSKIGVTAKAVSIYIYIVILR